jgi:hypothetical protein
VKILRIRKISRKGKLNMIKLKVPEKDILYELYIEKGLSMSSIATIFNTTSMTVRAWLNNYDVKSRISNISLYHELRDTDFTEIQKKLLIGSILGDGGLRIPKRGKNAYFYERHCEKQREYLEWKRDLLMPFVQRKLDREIGGKHIISGLQCTVQDSYKLSTISHSDLTYLWKKFYRGNGNKILPIDIDNYIDDFVISVWICDDGCLTWKSKKYRLDLHTESFTYEENLRIKNVLSNFFGGNICVYNRRYKSGTKHYISMTGMIELHNLCERLIDNVPDCMKYKFNTNI